MNTVVVVCILILFLVKRNKLDTHSLTPKFIEKLELPFKGSYNIPKFHYAAFHYITAHIPLACCTVIYNFMNYKSVSFHHSWNILPDVQITLWKTTTSKSALTEQPYLPQMDCGKMRKQATKNFNVTWLTKSIAFTAPDKIPHQYSQHCPIHTISQTPRLPVVLYNARRYPGQTRAALTQYVSPQAEITKT